MPDGSEHASPYRTFPVVSEIPSREVWRRLRLFTDEAAVDAEMRREQGIPAGHHVANTRKQAKQISQAVRQAEEYFRAASQVGLATRPLLLYYGVATLARAVVLYRGTGDVSLDRLRKAKRHNHHGLEVRWPATFHASAYDDVRSFFETLTFAVHVHPEHGPWGAFPLFYEALRPPLVLLRLKVITTGASVYTERDFAIEGPEIRPLADVANEQIDIWKLMNAFPDLWAYLVEEGYQPDTAPGRIERTSEQTPDPSNASRVLRVRDVWTFWAGPARPEQLAFIKRATADTPEYQQLESSPSTLRLQLAVDYEPTAPPAHIWIPDLVDTIGGRLMFVTTDRDLGETANAIAILFCLGMLARYYPDVWMRALTAVRVAELTDLALTTIDRKYPVLILDQLTGVKHYTQLT